MPVRTVVVPVGGPAFQILDQVRLLEADGIVMATHGRTGLAHLLYGAWPRRCSPRVGYPCSWCTPVQESRLLHRSIRWRSTHGPAGRLQVC